MSLKWGIRARVLSRDREEARTRVGDGPWRATFLFGLGSRVSPLLPGLMWVVKWRGGNK